MYACAGPRMLGPYSAPAGGWLIAASSCVIVDGMFTIVQCRIGAPRDIASPSCIITAYDFVPAGPADHLSPGNTFARQDVFSNGMSPPGANAGVVTVSFAPDFAGRFGIASSDAPTSVAGGACC